MKKLFILFPVLFLALFFAGDTHVLAANSVKWVCSDGTPMVNVQWDAVAGATGYHLMRNPGSWVYEGTATNFTDESVTYRTTYNYEFETNTGVTVDLGSVTTGSCAFVSSLSGPTNLNTGNTGTYSASFVADSGYSTATQNSIFLCEEGQACVGLNTIYPDSGVYNSSLTQNINFPHAGTYTVLARSQVTNPYVVDNQFKTVYVTTPKSATLSVSRITIDQGETSTATWTCTGTPTCYSSILTGQTVDGWSGDVSKDPVGSQTLTFNTVGSHSLKIAFGSDPEVSATAVVNVNQVQKALLAVYAYMYPDDIGGPSGYTVTINGTQAGTSGTTNAPFYSYSVEKSEPINTTLTAPSAPSGKKFLGWSGCDAGYVSPSPNCTITVTQGSWKSVRADYGPDLLSLPDLTVNSLSITPASPVAYGSTVTFTAVVKNNGSANVVNPSITWGRIDYDSNGTWDYPLTDQNTGNLTIGGTETETFTWSATRSGTHKVEICADEMNTVTESNEANNCSTSLREFSFTVGDNPNQPRATLNVNSSPTGVYVSRISGPSDIAGTTNYPKSYENNFSAELQAPATAPNGSTFSSWTGCDSTSVRNCTVSVSVGSSKTITANYNAASEEKPNFEVAGGINISPSSPSVGASVTFSATIRNSGAAPGPYNLVSNLFIDENNDGSTNFWEYTIPRTTGGLDPGQTKLETWNSAWVAKAGTHRIRICPDIPNLIEETNENDNCAADVLLTIGSDWDYTLSNTNSVTIDRKVDNNGYKDITRTVTSGTATAASTLSVSTLPTGIMAAIANNPCTPNCTSRITFTIDGRAPNGATPVTVTSVVPGKANKTLNFNLILTGYDYSVECIPDPATPLIGQTVKWVADIDHGTPPYNIVWSGVGVPTSPAPTGTPYYITYSTIGKKNIQATVTDANNTVTSCSVDSSVFVNFDPKFEEF